MTVRVDPAVLVEESAHLLQCSIAVDALAATFPSAVDGGDGGPLITALLAALAGAGSDLACGIGALADAMALSAQRYREQDLDTADAVNTTTWNSAR